ncbi:MAG: TldD/PmbA family protein [Planctomycetota bacterium]|jgi:PmbA protein
MTPKEIARGVFDEATRRKATGAEFFLRAAERTQAMVQGLQPESHTVTSFRAAGIRVFQGRRWGLCHTTDLSADSLRLAVAKALALAGTMEEDPHTTLVTTLDKAGTPALVDPALSGLTPGDRFDRALAIERGAYAVDRRVRSSRYVAFTVQRSEVFLSNTRGLDAGYEEASAHLSAMIGAGDGEAGQQLFGSQASRRLDTLDPETLGASIGRRLLATLGGVPLRTGRRDVVVDPSQSPTLLRALAEALNGGSVHLGRSYLRDRVGQKVASSAVTVMDDPGDAEEAGSVPWDDEGIRGEKRCLLEGGVLRGFLYDIPSASKAGTVSTGNGLRPDVGFPARVTPTHLLLQEGEGTFESLLTDVEEGFYITGFMGRGVDPVTGRVSAAALGARIRGGRLAEGVTGVTLSGGLDELLGAVDAVGADTARVGPIRAPSMRIRDVLVAGK